MTNQPTMADWQDTEYTGLIGDKEIAIVATMVEGPDDNAKVVLFKYVNYPGKRNVYALRWSIGTVMDLQTDDITKAKGAINTMITMEAADE